MIIELIQYQQTEVNALACKICKEIEVYVSPLGMPYHLLTCEHCLSTDCLSDKLPRRWR